MCTVDVNTMARWHMRFAEMPGKSRIFLHDHSRCENIQSWLNNKLLVWNSVLWGIYAILSNFFWGGKKMQHAER